MEEIRGKVPLNIDHYNNLNLSTQANPHKIFPQYMPQYDDMPQGVFYAQSPTPLMQNQYVDDSVRRAVAFVQAANPNAIGNGLEETIEGLKREQRNSPGKSKNKLGALYNPNYVDPRILPHNMTQNIAAGVKTNYGLQMERGRRNVDQNGQFLNPYYNNVRDDDNFILAQGPGTGTFKSGQVAKLRSLNRFSNYSNGKTPVQSGFYIDDMRNELNPHIEKQDGQRSHQEFHPEVYKVQGRHDYNPNTMKNINQFNNTIQPPVQQPLYDDRQLGSQSHNYQSQQSINNEYVDYGKNNSAPRIATPVRYQSNVS